MTVNRERYTPHDVGPSPLDWDAPYLEEVSSLITNGFVGTATPYYTDDSGIPYLYGTNVRANKLDSKDIRFVNREFHSQQSKTELKTGDLLTVQSGHIGETAVVTEEFDGANCHALIVTRTKKKYVFPQYLSYYINSEIGRARLRGLVVGSTILHINTKDLKKFRVLLPSINEQQKIAKILSTWDKAIATTESLIATSQQQKKALMQQLLTGKKRLVNPDTGMVFEGDWMHVSLGKLVKVTGGNAFKSEQFQESGIPLIKISNIKPNYSVTVDSSVFIPEDAKYQKFEVVKGDILIAMSGATTGKVGCYQFDEYSYLNQRVGRFDPKKGKIIKSYLFQLLKLPKIQHDILIDAVGGAQPNISNKDIERLKIIVPSVIEQQKIASVLTAADKEIELLEAKLAHLKDEKKALMQQLLTGKKRVKLDEMVAAS